ncbi:unnamed protein product [Rotaria sp. Silwood1]|nr:unnamed protein product [Rotaria sp. Silwood1]
MTYSDIDEVVKPKESGSFMSSQPNSPEVELWNSSRQLKEGLIRLRTLWEQKKLFTFTSHVRHQDITYAPNKDFIMKYILHVGENSLESNPSPNILLTKLNIPLNCVDNYQIRQHYLEEYSAKYSKAKHLLSNARKKQRKIIMTYYEAKEKENNIDELQIIKESLLEENEKIKKFKDALKDKLIIYQQRIQFLKDTEFWSRFEIQQLQSNTVESIENCTENSPELSTTKDSLHLLHDLEQIKYQINLLDDLCPTTNPDEHYSKLKSDENNFSPVNSNDNNKINHQYDNNESNIISHLTDNYKLHEIILKSSQRMILMFSLVVFSVIFLNNLLEYFLIYLTKPSVPITTLSRTSTIPISSFTILLSNIYNWTISWLLLFFRIFEFSV